MPSFGRDRSPLEGRTAFVTGPARGIGRETARQLAARGMNVGLAGMEPERLEELADEIGPRAAWFEADVRDAAALGRAVAGTVDRFGGIDVAIANAGIAPVGTVADMSPETFEDVIDVNLLGVYRTIRAALPHVTERKGYVLVVASMAAVVHLPYMAAYTAAKAGVSALGDVLRSEVAGTGTAVGVAYFGFVDTDMTREALEHPAAGPLRRGIGPPGSSQRPLPVEAAARAIVRGVERRSRWIVLPRSGWSALLVPGPVQRAAEAVAQRMIRS